MPRLNLREFSDYIGATYRTVKRWRGQGMPSYPPLGNTIRGKPVEVETDEALAWMRQQGKQAGRIAALCAKLPAVQPEKASTSAPEAPSARPPAPTLVEARDLAFGLLARGLAEIGKRKPRLDLSPRQLKVLLDIALVLEQKVTETDRDDELRQRPLRKLAADVQEQMARQFAA